VSLYARLPDKQRPPDRLLLRCRRTQGGPSVRGGGALSLSYSAFHHLQSVADPEGMPGMHRHTLRFRQLQVYVYVFRGKKINIHVKLSKPNQEQQRTRASMPSVRQAHAATRSTLPMRCATADGRTHARTELRETRIASSTRHSRVVVSPCVVPPLRSRSRHRSQVTRSPNVPALPSLLHASPLSAPAGDI
jgi:hypothetical protein